MSILSRIAAVLFFIGAGCTPIVADGIGGFDLGIRGLAGHFGGGGGGSNSDPIPLAL